MKFHPAFKVYEVTIGDFHELMDGRRLKSHDVYRAAMIWSKHKDGKIYLHKCRSSRFPTWIAQDELGQAILECYGLFLASFTQGLKAEVAKLTRNIKSAKRSQTVWTSRREMCQQTRDKLLKQLKRLKATL